jgi:hypothetical protein
MKKHVERLQIYIYLVVHNISERNLNQSINPECWREDTLKHPKTVAGSSYVHQATCYDLMSEAPKLSARIRNGINEIICHVLQS